MPIYTFRNNHTGELFDETMKISEMEEFINKNPHLSIVPAIPKFVAGRGTIKPDDGFTDILKTIKKQNPGSTIRTKN
jgi:hypothetical protein